MQISRNYMTNVQESHHKCPGIAMSLSHSAMDGSFPSTEVKNGSHGDTGSPLPEPPPRHLPCLSHRGCTLLVSLILILHVKVVVCQQRFTGDASPCQQASSAPRGATGQPSGHQNKRTLPRPTSGPRPPQRAPLPNTPPSPGGRCPFKKEPARHHPPRCQLREPARPRHRRLRRFSGLSARPHGPGAAMFRLLLRTGPPPPRGPPLASAARRRRCCPPPAPGRAPLSPPPAPLVALRAAAGSSAKVGGGERPLRTLRAAWRWHHRAGGTGAVLG